MDNVSLSFSQEEVVLILKILGTDTIPGVGQEPFGDVSEEVKRHLLASAERTLRARAMLSLDGERINIDQVVVALIGTCAVPHYSWLVTRTQKQQPPENRFYHITPAMFVEHTISGPGIHTFTALARQEQMVERLTEFWQLHSNQPVQEHKVVSINDMQRLLEQLMLVDASEAISDSPLPEPVLAINTVALIDHTDDEGNPSAESTVNRASPSTDLADVTSTSYIQCQNSLWQSVRHSDMEIELQPVLPSTVGEQLNAWQSARLDERAN